ncbi:MAG: flavodoxin family protein [Phycisphaerae bacterium]|nr:flavodoxin family protein [Phycisphaerae bacterium]
MKILTILGSPSENGNSTTLARQFNSTAEAKGAEVQTIVLNKLKYLGCQSCMACKDKAEKCIIKDDLKKVLDAFYDADIVVLASPVYFGDITGQLKLLIDRTFSLLTPEFMTGPKRSRLDDGKKFVFIQTQGGGPELFDDVYTRYELVANYLGFASMHHIKGGNLMKHDDATNNPELLAEVSQLADTLV